MEYIDRILVLNKRRLAENQKIKEELLKRKQKNALSSQKLIKNIL